MTYIMFFLLFSLILGLISVASNPSPYFAALGLVVASGASCGVLVNHGGPFLSLVLFLIYLGGMLVVFAYSAALAAEPFPESWGSRSVALLMFSYMSVVVVSYWVLWKGRHVLSSVPVEEQVEYSMFRGDVGGVALMYSSGGGMLIVSGWVLLLALFVVLELTRGLSRGALRAV